MLLAHLVLGVCACSAGANMRADADVHDEVGGGGAAGSRQSTGDAGAMVAATSRSPAATSGMMTSSSAKAAAGAHAAAGASAAGGGSGGTGAAGDVRSSAGQGASSGLAGRGGAGGSIAAMAGAGASGAKAPRLFENIRDALGADPSDCGPVAEPEFNIPVEKLELSGDFGSSLSLRSARIATGHTNVLIAVIKNTSDQTLCQTAVPPAPELTLPDESPGLLSLLVAPLHDNADRSKRLNCIPACDYGVLLGFGASSSSVSQPSSVKRLALALDLEPLPDLKPVRLAVAQAQVPDSSASGKSVLASAQLDASERMFDVTSIALAWHEHVAWPLDAAIATTMLLEPGKPLRASYPLFPTDSVDAMSINLIRYSTESFACDVAHPSTRSANFSPCGHYCLPGNTANPYAKCSEEGTASAGDGEACEKQFDCQNGLACIDSACSAWCRTDAECSGDRPHCKFGFERFAWPSDEVGVCVAQ